MGTTRTEPAPDYRLQAIVTLRDAGWTMERIAAAFGVTERGLRKYRAKRRPDIQHAVECHANLARLRGDVA